MKRFADSPHHLQEHFMTEAALRAYLLGKLTESEVDLVETRLVEDPDLFSQLETAEDDLFDAFARGALDADERVRFIERFGAAGSRHRFAKAFVQRTPAGKVVPFYRRRWLELGLAAGLAVVVGAFVIPRQAEDVATPSAAAPTAAAPMAPAAPVVARVSLALGASRAAGAPVRVTIAREVTAVELRIRLNPADRFAIYAVEIRSQADNIIWGNATLQATTDNGDLDVRALVPADRLPAGTYEIGVRGGAAASSLDDLGFLAIEVSRAQ
jgi:hypothetical protein